MAFPPIHCRLYHSHSVYSLQNSLQCQLDQATSNQHAWMISIIFQNHNFYQVHFIVRTKYSPHLRMYGVIYQPIKLCYTIQSYNVDKIISKNIHLLLKFLETKNWLIIVWAACVKKNILKKINSCRQVNYIFHKLPNNT
jgi:hypothetical protein